MATSLIEDGIYFLHVTLPQVTADKWHAVYVEDGKITSSTSSSAYVWEAASNGQWAHVAPSERDSRVPSPMAEAIIEATYGGIVDPGSVVVTQVDLTANYVKGV